MSLINIHSGLIFSDNIFKDISAATASRDLKKGTELKIFEKIGKLNKTIYKLITGHNTV